MGRVEKYHICAFDTCKTKKGLGIGNISGIYSVKH